MIVVIVALQEELSSRSLGAGVELVHCGVGKVNAAIATCEAVRGLRPALIVNYGTAGRLAPGLHGLVEVGSVLQRDMLAMPLAERGLTPFDATPACLRSAGAGVLCATGDSFVTATDPWLLEQGVALVDMELYAIARSCARFGVPWRSFKFITDEANDQSAEAWSGRVGAGEALFAAELDRLRARQAPGAG